MNSKDVILEIMRREGGFVEHSADKGGATKYGITIKTLEEYRGKVQAREDVFNLSQEEAYKIYADNYIIRPKFYLIKDERLRELVIDTGVHSGIKRAVLWLQEAAKVKADGIIGKVTLNKVNKNPLDVYFNFLALRIKFLGRLITKDISQAVFAEGWFNRISEFL